MKRATSTYAIGILVLIIILGTIYIVNKDTQTVDTTGTAKITVPPDQVMVYLAIETTADTAEQAKNDNAEITNNVLNSLRGIVEDVETENYNIYPNYEYIGRDRKLNGYKASNYIKVTTKEFNLAGKIIDAAVSAGALVNRISFELSTEKNNEYKTQALAEATKDAKTKAEAIAQGLGQKLGSLVSVSTSDYNYQPYPMFAMAEGGATKEVPTDIQPQNLEVYATVKAIYKIR